eukprot:comp266730_c0_seq1/m.50203 comp266730_c0_seq1/g.50203  ORF comp266730_c0_seq1/g.50203 comp266730_c0_seq1/m.50203 type:complete len:111 (-) comp266730_c0_seq1:250-582(-)
MSDEKGGSKHTEFVERKQRFVELWREMWCPMAVEGYNTLNRAQTHTETDEERAYDRQQLQSDLEASLQSALSSVSVDRTEREREWGDHIQCGAGSCQGAIAGQQVAIVFE